MSFRTLTLSAATFLIVGMGPALAIQGKGLDLATPGFDPARIAAQLGGIAPEIRSVADHSADLLLDSAPAADPVAAALLFIDRNVAVFVPAAGRTGTIPAPSKSLRVSRRIESGNRTHVTFEQTVRDLPVVGNAVLVHLDASNRTREFSGGLVPESAVVQAEFVVSSQDAVTVARDHLAATELRGDIATERAFLPTEAGLIAVHMVKVPAAQPLGDWTVYVDAGAGTVVAVDDAMCHATAKVYPDNPMAGDPETFDLTDLGGDKTQLSGPYAKVTNDDAAGAVATDGNFHYAPDDTHFDEAMVYTHLELIHRFYKDVLKFNKMDWVMPATVHYGDKFDNAFFSPFGKSLAFGDGNQLNDLSKEAGVVYHEYTHAVSGEMASLRWGEGGAMNEGYSDYIACTLDNDPRIGEYVMAKLGRPYMRHLESTKHYPEDLDGEVHADGEIWAASCWDLRKALGREVADPIVHESRNYLGWFPSFKKGAAGCIKADRALFGGAHVAQIVASFNARGIAVTAEESERTEVRRQTFEALSTR